jgi:uncharacterized phage-associated protein
MERTLRIFVRYLRDWYCEQYPEVSRERFLEDNDIDLLKFLKLIFFVSAVRGDDSSLLDGFFNSFSALPLGPVESNVYSLIKRDSFITISDNNLKITFEDGTNFDNFECPRIKEDFEKLKSINPDLIKYPSRQLVNISHKWDSWKTAYVKAEEKGVKSYPMNAQVIMNDYQYFF